MEFRVLGPLEVRAGGVAVAVGGPKQRALLALLLLSANRVVSRDRLIEELLGEGRHGRGERTLAMQVSRLRKVLSVEPSGDRLVQKPPGYLLRVEPGELDLETFEQLAAEGRQALEQGDPGRAADLLRAGLSLWRGRPLADLEFEPFARIEVERLEELWLAAVEERIAAELALGRDAALVPELEALTVEHPYRERLRAQLISTLYRSGRQADALAVYRQTRELLSSELGLEPSRELQELERAILRQDPTLGPAEGVSRPQRAVLVAALGDRTLDGLLNLAEPLAQRPTRELVLVGLVERTAELERVTARLNEQRARLLERGTAARATAFTSKDAAGDLLRLASNQSIDLILLDGSPSHARPFPAEIDRLLTDAPCDVALLASAGGSLPSGRPVLVPFGGAEHDWGAVELAAWIALALGVPLQLLGSGDRDGRRDASRLLANAALIVQRAVGVETEPVLAAPDLGELLAATEGCCLLVTGLSDRWRSEGLGETRLALARGASVPVLIVKRGLRPSGIAPGETLTRFTWSLPAG